MGDGSRRGAALGLLLGGLALSTVLPAVAKPAAGPAAQPAAQADGSGGWAGDCPTTLKMHGLLTRARVSCGFRFYSERMLKDAGQCQKRTAKPEVTRALTGGVKLFDAIEKKSGHKPACAAMAEKFPMVVQP